MTASSKTKARSQKKFQTESTEKVFILLQTGCGKKKVSLTPDHPMFDDALQEGNTGLLFLLVYDKTKRNYCILTLH